MKKSEKGFRDLFRVKCPIIGMIHVPALPGTPRFRLSIREILEKVSQEAELYAQAGVDGIAIENMHDIPYLKREIGPEITAMMTAIGQAVKQVTDLPCGIQILAGANQAALAAAQAANLEFIRAEGFVYGHLADEGLMDSDAGALLRYRRQIGAEDIFILTDIKKKHSSHAITADISLAETAHAAEFFLSDGLIVTGTATGKAAKIEDLKAVKEASQLPVLIGSGITPENLQDFFPLADGLIIGSYFKKGGYWENEPDLGRIGGFMDLVNKLRG